MDVPGVHVFLEKIGVNQPKKEARQMTELTKNSAYKTKIVGQIADLSRLLGMIPSDDTIAVNDPATHNSMQLSKWFSDTRNSFLRLSILLDKYLDLNLQ
jgi:hypothetical protein